MQLTVECGNEDDEVYVHISEEAINQRLRGGFPETIIPVIGCQKSLGQEVW